MKKILSIIVLLAGVISFTSCSDSDSPYSPASTLTLASSNLLFESAGGTGSIVVNTSAALTAETGSDWLTLTVSGNTVSVAVASNETIDGRSAKIVLRAGGDTTSVVATQKGMFFDFDKSPIVLTSNAAASHNIAISHSLPIKVETLADWITATVSSDSTAIVLNFAANESGHLRKGKYVVKSANLSDTVTITQYDFATNILGTYYFAGLRFNDAGKVVQGALMATLKGTPEAMVLEFPSIAQSMPVEFDEETVAIRLAGGKYMGTFDDYETEGSDVVVTRYVWSSMWDILQGKLSWTEDIGMIGAFDYSEEDAVTYCELEDDGNWGSYQANTFRFQYFTSGTDATSKNMVSAEPSNLYYLIYPQFIEYTAPSAAKSMGKAGQPFITDVPQLRSKVPFYLDAKAAAIAFSNVKKAVK